MSLFPSTLTGRILDDGVTEPPVIELQGISAGQLATVLTAYTPLETTTANTADIGTNAAAIAALQGQVAALPAAPDLTPYGLASDLAAAEGLIAANASGLTAVNTSLTLGLAAKASQSALDALQVEVDGKSTPASVDLKLSNHPTTAAMNSSIASANNATLASVATTYALKSVVDQLALDVAARQTAGDVAQAIATALLPLVSTSDLTAAVALRTTPADVSQLIATALLPFVQQAAVDAALALRDSRLDGHDTDILALQNAGPFATAGDLNTLQLTLQSAIDGILAEISTLGGATNLVNAPAWLGNVTWDLLAGTNTVRNIHATGPLSIALANDNWTLSFGCDAYTTQQTDDAIAAALVDYFTRTEVTVTVVAAIDESKGYTDTQLADYSTTAEMTQAITDALVPYGTAAQRDAAIAAALAVYYTSAQTDAALAAGLAPYSTTVQMNQAITDALVPFETAAQRDAAIAAALAVYYTSAQTDAALAAALASYYTSAETDAAIAAAVALSNGQSWTGGPTFNLLRGSNVLRNLSVAGALTATFQNLDDTILIESDSYARSETYTQLETGAAITAAIDALDLSQFQNEAEVQALIAAALMPYWDQGEVSSFVAGELSNYATSSSVTSAISSALSSYDNSSQVDSKIITALLDFYTRAEVDQEIADALGNVDLSNYYTQAETQTLYYPRTELDSLLTATLTQYWTSGRTQTEIDDAIAGAGFLTQAQADTRYFAVSANASFESLVRTNVTPPMIKALLPRAPLAANTILTETTLELTCDAYSKAEADGRYLSNSNFAPLDARYFARNPSVAEGNGLFHLVQDQFTPQIIRSLLFRPPLTGGAILGNGSVIEIEADCWSKAQSDSRYPLVATFNSLGSTVTSIDGRVSTLESDVPAIDGRVTALENSGGIASTADLTVNSLTATTFVETPQLQSAAGDLQIQNALVTVRKEDGALLASFADGGISLDRDVTVAAASTLNATTADITQLTVGSTAATGAFNSNSSVTANLEVVSNLRVEAPLVRCDPTAPWLSIEGGAQGVLVNDTLLVNGAIAPEASLPYLFLSGGTTGLEMNTKFAAVTGLGDPGGFCELAVINQAPTGVARLFLATNNNGAGGKGELVALASGGLQLNALNELMSFNTTSGLANMFIEPNTGGNNNGEVIFGYGHMNASDRKLKQNIRTIPQKQAQQLFDELEPKIYDRVEGPKDQIGFVAQDVLAAGELGKALCKPMGDGELLALDYQKLSVVLWGVVKSLQKRVDKLEKKRGRSS